jgi:diguanylate cyclase (GGDEF)-like protein/PAS domain S-box-containing protein
MELYCGDAANKDHIVYDPTKGADIEISPFDQTEKVRAFNRDWTLVTHPIAGTLQPANPNALRNIEWTGAGTTLVLPLLFWLLLRSRENQAKTAEDLRKKTEDLKKNTEALKETLENLESVVALAGASETRWKALFSNHAVVTLVVDPDSGEIIDANERAASYYGYAVSELVSKHVSDILDASSDEILPYLMRARSGENGPFRFQGRLASGEIRSVEISTKLVEISGKEEIVSIIEDTTEREQGEKRLYDMATHDALTGLPNRGLARDRLEAACTHIDRHGGFAALLFVDLDHFKEVNDSDGHGVGDLLLKEVAARMLATVRSEDTVARLGGDEFLIILPDIADASHAAAVAEKMIESLSETFLIEGREIHIGASIGIATYPKDAKDADALLKYGDIAMYQVKGSGRNGFQFFSPEMHEASVEGRKYANALRHAIERKEFSLNYQRIVDPKTEKVLGMEALLRWNNEELGNVSPAKFIPIAEDTGVIVEMGKWVVGEVCRQIAEWKLGGLEPPRIAINLSGRQFRKESLVDDIIETLRKTGTDPKYVGLEITESMMMENVEESIAMLKRLSDFGLEISIDDFGTGYSSLSYLKRFPVSKLKIDRSFVKGIAENSEDYVLVQSIIALARGLGLAVVAEGVENPEQLEALRGLGCDQIQGYYYGKPGTAAETAKRLKAVMEKVPA